MNMSYCRFQNTAQDLRDCVDHFDDEDLSREETRSRQDIWEMAREIMEEYPDGPPENIKDEDGGDDE